MERKSIFPKCEHMKLSMYANSLFGIWPFIFEDYPILKKIYDVYCKIALTWYFCFIVTGWIKLIQLFMETPIPITEIMANISITFIYSVTIWRARAIRLPRMMNIIKNIIDWEKRIMDSKDESIIAIYNDYAWQNKIISLVFIVTVVAVTSLFMVHPLGLDPRIRFERGTNVTTIIKPLPLSSWFPFDDQKHYFRAYMFHLADAYIGASFVNNTDMFSFGIITFPLGQIVILNYILSHFDEYVLKIQDQLGVERDEASFVTLRECIIKHKDIIEYIKAFNKEMNIVVLLDFLQSSLQLAAIVLQLMFFEVNLFNFIFSIMFAICMLTRLLGYYWYANEIIIESSNTPLAIWSGKWYEEPKKTQRMMLLMMLRCYKPLTLNIGPFNTMSLNTLLGILKTTYSYSMVVYKGKQSH